MSFRREDSNEDTRITDRICDRATLRADRPNSYSGALILLARFSKAVIVAMNPAPASAVWYKIVTDSGEHQHAFKLRLLCMQIHLIYYSDGAGCGA